MLARGNRWVVTAVDYTTDWRIAEAIADATEDAIAVFIFHKIYIHFGALQKIFSDGGSNLWGKVVEAYLKKIQTVHKDASPYHPRTNGRVEYLNGIIGGMLIKPLLGKSIKLWDPFLDQALFACRIRTHTTTKTSPFYLIYDRHPHLLGGQNYSLPVDATAAEFEEYIRVIQSVRQAAATATHNRAVQARDRLSGLTTPYNLEAGDWVLVRHEKPHKFESKWFGPYQIIRKMLLGTYGLQDPNGIILKAFVRGNCLLRANVQTTDELKKLWAALNVRNALRRQNKNFEIVLAEPHATDILDHFLQDDR